MEAEGTPSVSHPQNGPFQTRAALGRPPGAYLTVAGGSCPGSEPEPEPRA